MKDSFHRANRNLSGLFLFCLLLAVFASFAALLRSGEAEDYFDKIDRALNMYDGSPPPVSQREITSPARSVQETRKPAPTAQGRPAQLSQNVGEKVLTSPENTAEKPEAMEVSIHVLSRNDVGEFAENVMIDALQLKDMNITDVLKLISEKSGLNIIAGQDVKGKVTVYLRDVTLKEALTIILDANDLAYKVEEGIARVMSAKEFEMRYGYKFGGNLETHIVRLSYANGADVLPSLMQLKSANGKIIHDPKSNTLVLTDAAQALLVMRDFISKIDVPVHTKVYDLNYASAEEMSGKLGEILTKNVGQVKFDKRSNKIVISDTRIKIEEIDEIIKAFDVKDRQVLIEAKILQIVLSDEMKLGIDWEALVSGWHGLDLKSNFDILPADSKGGSLSIGTLSTDQYTVLIEALNTLGQTNILSTPSISAVNNQEAKILVGSTQPYVTTTTTTPSSGPTTSSESVNFIEVGVKLYVTPMIHKDDFITMKIKPEVSSVTSSVTTSNNNTIPVVETSEAETTVMVKDGVTIVIGGLIKEEKIESIKKVPFLGDVPALGKIFQNKDDLVRKTEIVIFLTPKIITGDISDEDKAIVMSTIP